MIKRRLRNLWILGLIVLGLLVLTPGVFARGDREEAPASTDQRVGGDMDPFGKYDPPVEVSAARILTSWMRFDEGEDLDNNWWMRAFRDELGIIVDWAWTAPNWGEPYEQKVYTSLATNQLPDMMNVYGSIFKRLAESDRLADLTEVYEAYASDELRRVMEANDQLILRGGMVDGKLLALGLPSGFNLHAPAVYYRADWLDNLGLDVPTNFEEFEAVALAFATQDPDGNGVDDTYGIFFDKNMSSSEYLLMAVDAHFNGWVETADGIEPGRIQPEMRDAWALLADWYEKGILSRDFALKSGNEEGRQDIISGRVGIKVTNYSDFDAPEFRDQHINEPDSDWVASPLYHRDGGLAQLYVRTKVQDFNVVSANAEHPEAAIKMLNLMLQVYSNDKPEFVTSYDYHVTDQGSLSFFMAPFRMVPSNLERDSMFIAHEAIQSGRDPATLSFEARDIYEKVTTYERTGDVDLWGFWKKFRIGGSMSEGFAILEANPDMLFMDPVYWTETEADADYGPDMNSRFKEFAILAIMEGDIDRQFDDWLAYFHNNGGREILEQNNALYR